jgi:small subunit ribosomal protein S1
MENTQEFTQDVVSSNKPSILSKFKTVDQLLDSQFEGLEMDESTFDNLYGQSFEDVKEEQLVKGKIVEFSKDEVIVDIGFKSYGFIPRGELINPESYKIGEVIEVYVERLEDNSGRVVLSRRRADFMKIWDRILEIHEKQETISVKILRRIKGGMVVDLLGIEAFLPGSQIDVRPVRDFDAWVSQNIDI